MFYNFLCQNREFKDLIPNMVKEVTSPLFGSSCMLTYSKIKEYYRNNFKRDFDDWSKFDEYNKLIIRQIVTR